MDLFVAICLIVVMYTTMGFIVWCLGIFLGGLTADTFSGCVVNEKVNRRENIILLIWTAICGPGAWVVGYTIERGNNRVP